MIYFNSVNFKTCLTFKLVYLLFHSYVIKKPTCCKAKLLWDFCIYIMYAFEHLNQLCHIIITSNYSYGNTGKKYPWRKPKTNKKALCCSSIWLSLIMDGSGKSNLYSLFIIFCNCNSQLCFLKLSENLICKSTLEILIQNTLWNVLTLSARWCFVIVANCLCFLWTLFLL